MIMKNIPGFNSSVVLSILSFILLLSNSVFSTNEVFAESEEHQIPSLLDPMYLYYLDGAQDSSEEEWPVIEEDDQESDASDLDDMSLEKRGDMWKFRSGKRGDLWKFRGGKRGNQWKFRGGKRGETLWKFRGGKRADLWKFRGGKRALTNGKRESLWKLRGGKRAGSTLWKFRSG